MLEIAIGALTTLLGVALGCTMLELAMRALKRSLGSYEPEPGGEDFETQPSLVDWEEDQVPDRIPSIASGRPLLNARNSVRSLDD